MNFFSNLRVILFMLLVTFIGIVNQAWSIPDDKEIKFRLQDDETISVLYKYVKKAITISSMLEDFESGGAIPEEIPLHNVTTPIFRLIVAGLKDLNDDNLDEFTKRTLYNLSLQQLGQFISAANYLDCKPLLDSAARTCLIRMRTEVHDAAELQSIIGDFNKDIQYYIGHLYFKLYPLSLLTLHQTIPIPQYGYEWALSADGTTMAMYQSEDKKTNLRVLKLDQGKFQQKGNIKEINFPHGIVLDFTGRYVALIGSISEANIKIIDNEGKDTFDPFEISVKEKKVYLLPGQDSALEFIATLDDYGYIRFYKKELVWQSEIGAKYTFAREYLLDQKCDRITFGHAGTTLACFEKRQKKIAIWRLQKKEWVDFFDFDRKFKHEKWLKEDEFDLPIDIEFLLFSFDDQEIIAGKSQEFIIWRQESDRFKYKNLIKIKSFIMDIWPDGKTIAAHNHSPDKMHVLKLENDEPKIIESVFYDAMRVKVAARGVLVSVGWAKDNKNSIKVWGPYEYQPSDLSQYPLLQVWLFDRIKQAGIYIIKASSLEAKVWELLDQVLKDLLKDKVKIVE